MGSSGVRCIDRACPWAEKVLTSRRFLFLAVKMSDKRRRRRQNSEGSEQSESDETESKDGLEEVDMDKDEGVDSAPDQGDSEYESADDDIENLEENLPGENGSGEEPYPEPGSERQEGDGEETPSLPTLDDDEDK